MQRSLVYTYLGLLALTLSVAALAAVTTSRLVIITILLFSLVKFWLVAFRFMELKKAHTFWKALIIIFGALVAALLILFRLR
ncbi:MAG: cytochrome C oxidase subunit IV family protein [Chitinophagaceae bacterium]|nr:cytochrome C oxidase subunit IV family protein [Chitinophagaceae bacterium]